jgi:hypothetical protein
VISAAFKCCCPFDVTWHWGLAFLSPSFAVGALSNALLRVPRPLGRPRFRAAMRYAVVSILLSRFPLFQPPANELPGASNIINRKERIEHPTDCSDGATTGAVIEQQRRQCCFVLRVPSQEPEMNMAYHRHARMSGISSSCWISCSWEYYPVCIPVTITLSLCSLSSFCTLALRCSKICIVHFIIPFQLCVFQ